MRQITTAVEIASSPEVAWEILMDFAAYPDWNPFVREITGNPSQAEQLTVRLWNPGGKAVTFTPHRHRGVPDRAFSWFGKLEFKGVFDGHHHFQIEAVDDTGVRFTQSEDFSGALVPGLWGRVNKKTRPGFDATNAALKERAERR